MILTPFQLQLQQIMAEPDKTTTIKHRKRNEGVKKNGRPESEVAIAFRERYNYEGKIGNRYMSRELFLEYKKFCYKFKKILNSE